MLVSVVIPTFNRGSLLVEAVESAINQDYPEKEILLVDDCSSDDTRDLAMQYEQEVKYIRHKENKGVGAARNTGIRNACGKLIAFLDSDDVWLPNKLSAQVRMYKRYPDSGIVAGGCILTDLDGNQIGVPNIPKTEISLESISISVSIPAAGSSVLIPREVIQDIGGFAEDMVRAQDYHLFLRIAKKYPIRAVREVLTVVRVHGSERPGVNLDKTLECRKRIQALIDDPILRRKNGAWAFHSLGQRLFFHGNIGKGVLFFIRSFLSWPLKISESHRRLRPLIGRIRDRVGGRLK